MSPALKAVEKAAVEINKRWDVCLEFQRVSTANCPTNEEVAEIIRRHLSTFLKKDK